MNSNADHAKRGPDVMPTVLEWAQNRENGLAFVSEVEFVLPNRQVVQTEPKVIAMVNFEEFREACQTTWKTKPLHKTPWARDCVLNKDHTKLVHKQHIHPPISDEELRKHTPKVLWKLRWNAVPPHKKRSQSDIAPSAPPSKYSKRTSSPVGWLQQESTAGFQTNAGVFYSHQAYLAQNFNQTSPTFVNDSDVFLGDIGFDQGQLVNFNDQSSSFNQYEQKAQPDSSGYIYGQSPQPSPGSDIQPGHGDMYNTNNNNNNNNNNPNNNNNNHQQPHQYNEQHLEVLFKKWLIPPHDAVKYFGAGDTVCLQKVQSLQNLSSFIGGRTNDYADNALRGNRGKFIVRLATTPIIPDCADCRGAFVLQWCDDAGVPRRTNKIFNCNRGPGLIGYTLTSGAHHGTWDDLVTHLRTSGLQPLQYLDLI